MIARPSMSNTRLIPRTYLHWLCIMTLILIPLYELWAVYSAQALLNHAHVDRARYHPAARFVFHILCLT